MGYIATPEFETTAFQIVPYTIQPEVSDDIQQALSRLVGWDAEAQTWRFVRVNDDGSLFSVVGPEQASSFNTSTFTVTTTAQIVLGANSARKKILFYNNSSTTIYIGNTSSVTTSTGFPISQGAYYEETFFNGAYYGIVSSGTANLRLLEYT